MTANLAECTRRALIKYFNDLDGESASAVYEMVMRTVELPMLEIVMKNAHGRQSVAAEILGLNRNTLRKKLREYGLI